MSHFCCAALCSAKTAPWVTRFKITFNTIYATHTRWSQHMPVVLLLHLHRARNIPHCWPTTGWPTRESKLLRSNFAIIRLRLACCVLQIVPRYQSFCERSLCSVTVWHFTPWDSSKYLAMHAYMFLYNYAQLVNFLKSEITVHWYIWGDWEQGYQSKFGATCQSYHNRRHRGRAVKAID